MKPPQSRFFGPSGHEISDTLITIIRMLSLQPGEPELGLREGSVVTELAAGADPITARPSSLTRRWTWTLRRPVHTGVAVGFTPVAGPGRSVPRDQHPGPTWADGDRHHSRVTTDSEGAAAVNAVVTAVRRLGLATDAPVVLGEAANIVVWLTPAPVVARVATLTAEMRGQPEIYLDRERDIAAALARMGLDVIRPTTLVDPGPHRAGPWSFLLLEHRRLEPLDTNSTADADAAAAAFVELSLALADLPPSLSEQLPGHPWTEMATLADTVASAVEPSTWARISAVIEELKATEPDDQWQLVHGDAHRVNVARCDGNVVWYDFEDANRRPLAWDLATLRRAWPRAGDTACRLLGVDPASPSMRWHHELRETYALLWNLLYAQRYQHAKQPTAVRLRQWLATR